jgi:hypothetical protein
MMQLQDCGVRSVIVPQSVASNATATGRIDTLGYDEVKILVHLDSAASTTSNPAQIKVLESEDTVVTNFAAITGFDGDATDGFVIPAVSASLGTIVALNLDLRKRKRYLRLLVQPSTAGAMLVSADAVLGRAENSANAHADAGIQVDG